MERGDLVAERFEVAGLAGSGAMGRVYKAYDRQLGQLVALKLMSANAPSARFQREAEVLAGLQHPNIVRHVAHGFWGGELYLAMDWLEGEDLASRLSRGPLSSGETLVVARQVAEALGTAHGRGVVHRDVKPSNLVLVQGSLSDLRLVDFGLAAVDASMTPLTQIGLVLGTPAYMAPEQVRGDSGVDARADIFSLGCVLFECLAGCCPFGGDTPLATFARILVEDAPRVRELARDVPEALDDLIAGMLQKRPEERHRDGRALAGAIGRITGADMSTVGPAKPPSLTRLEQRLVSVVLLDKVLVELDPAATAGASTAASGDLDGPARAPTLLHLPVARSEADVVRSRLEAVRAIAGRFGGEVDPLPDGSMLIVHVAQEGLADPAARGARAALAVRAVFPFVSIGLATGRSTTGQTRTIGEALDRAAALLTRRTLAHGIWIDDVSRGLLEARFEIDANSEGTRLTGERGAAKAERTLLGRQTSCVGREPDLSTLLGLLDATVVAREPRAALVLAAAGVGKSRLRYEFLRRASFSHLEASIWVGWGDPMGVGSPYGLVAPLIRRVLGISDLDAPEQRRRTIFARVERVVSSSEALRVAEFLGELVGAHFPDEGRLQLRAARNDAVLLGDQVLRAWGDFVAAEAARSPVVIVLEDAHWGDWPSLRLVDAAMASAKGLPVFVLALARPEITARFPDLWAERSVNRMTLSELDAEASRVIITNALGRADESLIVRLIERAAGNAFYLEELIRAVADGRGISLPGTVLAVAQARLEGLTDAERRLLRAGSIFGASFATSAVLELLGRETDGEIEERLAALTEREILLPVKDRLDHDAPEARFAFRHAILRDAAYAMLTPEDCALGHRLAGEWLERQPAGDPIVVAEHLERGGAPERAGRWYRKAAAQALEGNDFGEVSTRVESAFRCSVTGVEAGLVHLVAAEANRWSSDNAGAARHGCAAMALLPHGSLPWFSAAGEAALALGRIGRFGELKEVARELDAASHVAPSSAVIAALARVSDQLLFAGEHALYRSVVDTLGALAAGSGDDPVVETWLIYVRAGAAMMSDAGDYVMQMRALVASFEGIGDVRNVCLQRVNLADAYIQVGLYAEAVSLSRETLAESNDLGLRMIAGVARSNLARALGEVGQLSEARALAAEVVAQMHVGQDHRIEATAQGVLARVLMMSGELQAAADAVRSSLTLNRAPPPVRAHNLAGLAEVLLAQQRPAEALPLAEEAFALLTTLGTLDEGEVYVELIHAEALLANGRKDAARASIERARSRLLYKARTMSSAQWRTVFLTKVDANARTLALAGRLCGP